jgi:putative ABC transport system substrate-binding protein
MPALAADIVGRKVDLIVTINGTPWALAAKGATDTIPIVFLDVGDPIGNGLVANLARPGGDVTGFTNIASDLNSKRVQLLSELVPQAKAFVLLVNPKNPNSNLVIRDMQEAIRTSGAKLTILSASTPDEIDAAFASLVQPDALVVHPDSFLDSQREQIVGLAARHGIPAVYGQRRYVTAGGLISYGENGALILREVGRYAGRILKGAKPGDLPVQQPTKFELVINLKTAKALGLAVPHSLLQRADEVIE